MAYNVISVLQARKKIFKVITEDDKNERRGGRMKLMCKPSEVVKLIGNETIDDLYQAQMDVMLSEAVIAKSMGRPQSHARMGYYKKCTLGIDSTSWQCEAK